MHPALSALGLTPQEVPSNQEAALLHKLCTDNYFYGKVLQHLVETNAAVVLDALHELEKKRLREKLIPPMPPHVVSWTVGIGRMGGWLHVRATCPHGESWWDGHPDKLGAAAHCGSSLPANVRSEYARRWAPPQEVTSDMVNYFKNMQQPAPITHSELTERDKRPRT